MAINIAENDNEDNGVAREYTYGIVSNYLTWMFVCKRYITGTIQICTDSISDEVVDLERTARRLRFVICEATQQSCN